MKFIVSLKDPDGFSDSVRIGVDNHVARHEGLDAHEKESLLEYRLEKTWQELEKFVSYQECIQIEFDTEAGTATVLPRR